MFKGDMPNKLWRATALWLLIACMAAINGGLREFVWIPNMGEALSQVLSGLLLCSVIVMLTYCLLGFLKLREPRQYWGVGVYWLVLTLALELVLGHLARGASIDDFVASLNPQGGNLMILVFVLTLLSPVSCARWKGYC